MVLAVFVEPLRYVFPMNEIKSTLSEVPFGGDQFVFAPQTAVWKKRLFACLVLL